MITLEVSDNRKYGKNTGIVAEILEQGIEPSFLFEAKIFLNCLKLSSFFFNPCFVLKFKHVLTRFSTV